MSTQAIVIGNFDGVHRGHQHLFRIAKMAAGGGRVAAVTFEPLPAAVLRPEIPMGRLTPRGERAELLRSACAVDEVVELDATGNIVWSRDGFNGAMAADRLADGRTLVLDAQQGMIVELDAAGAETGRKPLRGVRGATGMDAY